MRTCSIDKNYITSKFRLTLLPTGNNVGSKKLDELDVLHPDILNEREVATLSTILPTINIYSMFV